MGTNIWACILGIIALRDLVQAQTNTTEVIKTTLIVADVTTTTVPPAKTNEAAKKENETFRMQPITQPIAENRAPTQQVGRTILPIPTNTSTIQPNNNLKPANFRPSPQLDTYYEYNRFPVVPALPEAKHFSGINLHEKPIRSETPLPWLERPNFQTTTQQPWYNKINFPTTQNPYLTVRDHPYPYLFTGGYPETTTRSQFPFIITSTSYPDITSRGPYHYGIGGGGHHHETTTRNPGYGNAGFSKFGGFPLGNTASFGGSQQGFNNKFGSSDKGSLFGTKGGIGLPPLEGGISSFLQKTNFENSHSVSAPGGSSGSPWKKIIKFLTAFIPIGLLLSALTPTVINVSPMNMTQIRGRAANNDYTTNQLISSLNYINKLNSNRCEERVICELLMGAGSSKNAEKHVENLLEAFTEQERSVIDQIQELKKIFEAVKSGTCATLACDKISDSTTNQTEDVDVAEEDAKSSD